MNIAIVGAGKLGLKVADALLGGDHAITIIEESEEKLPYSQKYPPCMEDAAHKKHTERQKSGEKHCIFVENLLK